MHRDTVTTVFCPETERSHQARSHADTVGRNGERILVVEDEPELMDYIAMVLRTRGYEVFEAADAEAALTILRQDGGFHLVLCDIGLPGEMDGIALALTVRNRIPGLRFLFMSGNAHDSLTAHGMNASDIELLAKPFWYEEMLVRVRAILDTE